MKALLGALLALSIVAPAAAQVPGRPVNIVVPVGPGGGTDLLAREAAKRLSEIWGQSVVVENRSGAAGLVGAQSVIRAAPDGNTLLFTHDGVITATPVLYKRPDYDPHKQLVPLSQLAFMPYIAVVHPSVQAKSVPELIALIKQKNAAKDKFGFATSALGSADHLAGEQFRIAAGLDMLIVPYKSAMPAMTDVIAGHLQLGFFTIASTQPHIKAGTLRAVGIMSRERSKLFPELATFSETLPGFVGGTWYGLFAPAGTPAATVEKISSDIRRAVASPEMASYMLNNGFVAASSTPAEFAEFIRKDSARVAEVIRQANVRVE
jgi:tripartite-type tricarboxylate transporter receptor subunit TctC